MSTEAVAKTQVVDPAPAATAVREFVYPTVHWVATPTAHPSAEAWPVVAASDLVASPIADRPRSRRPRRRVHAAATAPAARAARLRTAEDNAERFIELQKRMAVVEAASDAGAKRSLVVVPSRTVDKWHEPQAETQAYEERLLCSLLELRDPNVRMIYATSAPIAPAIVDYYLSLLPRRIRRDARSRLALVALDDCSARPLSQKLLERPRLLERLRHAISGWPACHLVPYNTTSLERDVALALDIPMYGADPRHAHFGTKSGCRALFAQAGVPHPAGIEDIESTEAAIEAIVHLRATRPDLRRLVMKCNEGVSGDGNALVDLTGLPAPGSPDEVQRIAERVMSLAPEAESVTPAAFLAKLEQRGGVVEEWITADELMSPSVQLQITPSGEPRLLSTHDQILGGPSGQSYLGCRFPAAPSYAPEISALSVRVGERLAEAGVIGRFAIDFVVARDGGGNWRPSAIEINLRKGGTTHPYETLAALTGGVYDPESATFVTPTGLSKHYVATDHLEDERLCELGHRRALGLARSGELRFDRMRRTGAVFHMLSSLDELGRTGFTAIADSADEADELYSRVQRAMVSEAMACLDRGSVRPRSRPQQTNSSLAA